MRLRTDAQPTPETEPHSSNGALRPDVKVACCVHVRPLVFIPLVTAIFVLAGVVKGVTGMGLPTIGIGLLSTVMPPVEAAALMIMPTILTNLWQLATGPDFRGLALRLWPMMGGICLGTWMGSGLLSANAALATAALGGILVVYAGFGLANRRPPPPSPQAERWLGPLMGTANGVVVAATGVSVIPRRPISKRWGSIAICWSRPWA